MRITKVAVKIARTDEIVAEDRVHRVAMAAALAVVKAGLVVRAETARKGIVRPANAVDREPAPARVVVASRSARAVVILTAENRANVVRLRHRCRRSMSR